MERGWIVGLAIAGSSLWGCASDVQTAEHAGSAAGSGAAGASGGSGGGVSTGGGSGVGAGGGVSGKPLSGHYMQQMIGNCINFEEWLSFSPPKAFTHTGVDRDYCGAHSVTATPGSQEVDGAIVEIAWEPETGSMLRRFTFARVDPYPGALSSPIEPGYEPGTAALNTTAYARSGAPLTWHREDRRVEVYDGTTWDQHLAVDLTFAAPLGTPTEKTACSLTVAIAIEVAYDGDVSTGNETFALPCTYGPDEALPWIRVVADGFENIYDGSWGDYLGSLGIWSKYTAWVQNAFSGFYPMFYYVPGDDSRLFQDTWQTCYLEMKSPPPDTVD